MRRGLARYNSRIRVRLHSCPFSGPVHDGVAMRILVVEDDKDVAGFVVRGLKEAGHVVEHADNGRDGLFMAASEAFDAVILDLSMNHTPTRLALLSLLRAAQLMGLMGFLTLVSPVVAQPVPAPAAPPPLQSLPSLKVPPYLGTWYQVALFPNAFQKQCVSDTTATYRALSDGSVEVTNRCKLADGRWDEAVGMAVPTGRREGEDLQPAQLKVSFLPAALRWLPVGWGAYWVIQLADNGRYAVVSEPSRKYLWVRLSGLVPASRNSTACWAVAS